MKTAKKLTAILLTVIMLQSFSLAAYAADYTTNSRFAIISATEANTKYNNGDKFIFMFYNPSCVYCKNIGNNVVSVWMNTYGITVYGVNASGGGFPQFMVKDLGLSVSTPVIGFISGGSGTYYQGNTSATTLNNAFYSFYGITPTVSVTGVSISNSSASLTVGGTKQLSATVSPSNATNKSVTWTSSNTSVASVSSSGLVTAKAPGNATITVKTSDGGYTSSCSVTVSAASNEAIEIRNPSTTTISYGDSIILHADINGTLPAGARIEWTASNGNFDMSVSADGTTCKISPKSSGKTVFTATVYDQNGNVISSDTQEMTAKAGLFDKIVAFFKKIFGMTETIPEAFKSIF